MASAGAHQAKLENTKLVFSFFQVALRTNGWRESDVGWKFPVLNGRYTAACARLFYCRISCHRAGWRALVTRCCKKESGSRIIGCFFSTTHCAFSALDFRDLSQAISEGAPLDWERIQFFVSDTPSIRLPFEQRQKVDSIDVVHTLSLLLKK